MNDLIINTPSGEGKVEKLYVSDLGYLMLRIQNRDKTYTTYNMGTHDINDNFFTNSLNLRKKGLSLLENKKHEI
jgi:hypothetical protein